MVDMIDEPFPVHPGAYIRENILKPRKLSATGVAKLVGVSRASVSNFLNGKVSATPYRDTASLKALTVLIAFSRATWLGFLNQCA